MKNFINQINMYEARLSKLGVGPKSNEWNGKFKIFIQILMGMILMN